MAARRRAHASPPSRSPSPARRGWWGATVAVAVTATAVMVMAALLGWRPWRPPLRVDGPIILISLDTLRADHLPAYGYRHVSTPALDALVADAVLFERAYSHAPQTLPSHASIFSGRLPFEHGVRDNLGFTVRPDERSLPRVLSERGFATAGIVSSYVLRAEVGIGDGFDLYDSQMPVASPEMSIAQMQRDGADSLAVADRWLDSLRSPRLFLFLHLYEPHKPYTPPSRFSQYAPYDGEIAYADEIVGRLLDSLRARGLYESATIIVLSDHGEGLGDHGEQEHGIFVYDESIRVPLIIKLPGGLAGGRRVSQPVQHIDLLPTILDLVDAPRDGLRGRSLRPLLEWRERPVPEQYVYSEGLYSRYHFGWSELTALTDAHVRFIRAPREELYDLERDPDERQNIAEDRARTVQDMRLALDQLLSQSTIEAPSEVSEEVVRRLRALGYVGGGVDVAPGTAGETLPDPKDQIHVLETYRQAVDLAGTRRFADAIELLEEILAENPEMADVWQQLGDLQVRSGRLEQSVQSYRRLVELKRHYRFEIGGLEGSEFAGLIAVANSLLKLRRLDEAWEHGELAVTVAEGADRQTQARAHGLLVRIALAKRDREAVERHAILAREADPTLPLPTYAQALMLHADGRYAEALPLFQETLQQLRSRTVMLNEAHFYTGDTLARLEQYEEAEAHFKEELGLWPHHPRSRAGLAMLYQSQGRETEAGQAIADLLETVPTPEGYGLAARLWTMFGDVTRAEAIRARAREQFADDPALAALENASF